MPKVPLSTITSGYGTVDALNANFDAIEAAFDNTLSRDGDTPNEMSANLDMNGNALLNVGTINGAPITALNDISGYVNTALAAATSASASATSATNTYDLFDDRYLGSKTSNPTVDNDGNALQVGAEYWNSVSNERRTWTGSAWVSSVTVVPDASVTTAKWSSTNGQLAGMRNKIINGKMEIAQRGTSFASPANNIYTLDRWTQQYATSASFTITQSSDVPSNNEFQNSLRLTVNTADTVISGGDYAAIVHKIEGFNVRDLIGRTFSLSFWVRSSKTGIHCVNVGNANDRQYVVEYTINTANTWEFKTVTVVGGLITAGTWNWTNGLGLNVCFSLASAFSVPANSWQTAGSPITTSNQVNCLDTIGNIFAITGVQLEPGASATPFEHRPYGAELALCQRYLPAWNGSGSISAGWTSSSTTAFAEVVFPVRARIAPTGISVSSASHFGVFNSSAGSVAATALAFNAASDAAGRINVTVAGGLVAGNGTGFASTSSSAILLFTGCEL